MRKLITPQDMRTGEARYFAASGVPSIEVMERAAAALANVIASQLPAGSTICFACGTGGNGGDGSACARLLHESYSCAIVQPKPAKTPDAIENLRRARECGIAVVKDASQLPPPDAWVDALFGTGLTRAPGGAYAALIGRINADHACGTRVYAADIPSGLNGETGQAYDPCVQADASVTFQFLKSGMTLSDGLDVCGEIRVADVGFPEADFDLHTAALFEPNDLRSALKKRPRNVHKGDCGHLLIVAGSFGMAGAAALCARAALRSGAGLVSIACPRSIVPILQTLSPQAMCIPLPERDGAISAEALPELEAALRGKSAVALGPGLSRRADAGILRLVLESGLPAVIDADGLNLLAEKRGLLPLLTTKHVLTPHPGEAARLLGHSCVHPLSDADELAALGANVLLKGSASVIRAPERPACISASGCPGMARAGSGDILTGILGALLADRRGVEPACAAACASEIHGLAGELAQKKYGARSMNAADILEFLPEVFREYVE